MSTKAEDLEWDNFSKMWSMLDEDLTIDLPNIQIKPNEKKKKKKKKNKNENTCALEMKQEQGNE